jgi:hypothetical protein
MMRESGPTVARPQPLPALIISQAAAKMNGGWWDQMPIAPIASPARPTLPFADSSTLLRHPVPGFSMKDGTRSTLLSTIHSFH